MTADDSAETRYGRLHSLREPFLWRARACAQLTVPHLMPPSGHDGTTPLPTPYQSVGARGLNNLAVRMLLALLPPNSPFFKYQIDDFVLQELTGKDDMRAEMEEALSSIERAIQGEVETRAIRVPAFEMLKQLISSGNALIHLPKKGPMRVFRLDTYVVRRDPVGNVLEMILKESVSPKTLPKEIQALANTVADEGGSDVKRVDLFTCICRRDDKWEVWQEIGGKKLPGAGTYPLDKLPWVALRLSRIDGEDYGRGYVEQYIGDLRSLEELTRAIVEGSAAAAKTLFLIKPNSTTRARSLAKLPNGAIAEGNADDVTTLQVQKFNDFRVAFDTIAKIEQRLEFAFLLTSSIQRSGERVTAEEIRRVASDLEVALGGVYALLSQEFQLPLVTLLSNQMNAERRLPKLPQDKVKPTIVTGLEALGRGNDADRLATLLQDLMQFKDLIGPRLNVDNLVKRLAAARQVDAKGLLKTEEQLQAEQQQAQMASMMQHLGPNAVNQFGGMVQTAMAQQGQEGGPPEGGAPPAA